MSKIQLVPKEPPALDPMEDRYWNPRDLEDEMRRTFEVCHGCRMCVGYCGTFPDLFTRVDRDIETRGALGAELLDAEAFERATELCWQCKLCYIKCPYTADEGHAWRLDVPRLLMREKAQRTRRSGISIQDKVLGEPQVLGQLAAGPLARVANLVNASRLVRKTMEATAGISASFPLPPQAETTFARWLAHHEPLDEAGTRGTVAMFATCLGDYNFPRIAASAVRVLERNGWKVVRPEQTCCGMPNLDGGNVAAARAKAQANVLSFARELDLGRTIVTIQPTCGYMAKHEWHILEPTDTARRVSGAVIDIMELLDMHRRDNTLSRDFSKGLGKVAYHASCHLRAQKIGYPGLRILNGIPDTQAEIVEHCSAVDGTWGMKAQHYEMGQHYARKLIRGIEALEPELVVSDCALAGCRIRGNSRHSPVHPIEALAQAYGIAPDIR